MDTLGEYKPIKEKIKNDHNTNGPRGANDTKHGCHATHKLAATRASALCNP